ncbi:ABC transporter ATP-binding protein [Sedimentibacter sp. zth1]|nr:ABC transporter ATP-binding protein [Sedimentibacter sp. zth1]
MKMDFKFTEDRDVLTEYHNADYAVGSSERGFTAVYTKVFNLLGRILAFGGYIAIVLTLSPWVLLYLLANVLVVYKLTVLARKYEYSRLDEKTDNRRKQEYIYKAMSDFAYGKDIRIYKIQKWLVEKFVRFTNKNVIISKEIANKHLKVSLVDAFLLLIREGIIYAYLIYRVIVVKDMSIDNFIMYFTTIAGFAVWMQSIMNDIAFIKEHNMYVSNYLHFMSLGDDSNGKSYEEVPMQGSYEIEFKNVAFKYPNSDRYIYKNLSLKIREGQRLAIVGVNGAGKTTFVKLLCRLYEPTEGEILLNGINIQKFNKEEYYKLFSPVFQDIKMFAFSISENVALTSKEKIDRKKVVESIDRADVLEKVNSLEKGIDTSLLKFLDSEGIELSGGENQKLALARALYKNGGIVVLDEPTAALDAISEYKTYMRFNDFVGDKTAIYVSHRLASTRFCDVIAFFENGEVKEYGTHEELLEKNGRYREMFDIQARYYREDVAKEEA